MSNRFARMLTQQHTKVLSGLLFIVLVCAPVVYAQTRSRVVPEAVGLSSERLKRLSTALNGYVKDGRLPGGVALVARRGKVVYVEAFGQETGRLVR